MKKYYFLIIVALILGLVLTGCSLLSNIGQAPATGQSGIAYLTKGTLVLGNLVGLWHFDDDALDYSGNLNHGTLMGEASWTSGEFGNALSLDGTEDYVSVADSTSLDITTELTIEAWVHTDVSINGTTQMQIVDKGEHNYSSAYMLMIYNGDLYGRVNKNSATACIYASYPNDGDWHHVAYTFKSGEQKLYIDGSNVISETGVATIATNAQPLIIGRGVDRPQYCWNGAIDEVRVWNSVLDASQLDDMLPPVVSSPNDGATYLLNEAVSADWSAADGTGSEPGSGVTGVASVVGSIIKGSALDMSTVGTHTFTVTATDYAMNTFTEMITYTVIYDWAGFFPPVDNDVSNVAKAGRAIPVKFSLNGYQGLEFFAADYPNSYKIDCDTTDPINDLEDTMTAGGSSLSYDATTDQYIYVWKTAKDWVGCRRLEVKLKDDQSYYADFQFK